MFKYLAFKNSKSPTDVASLHSVFGDFRTGIYLIERVKYGVLKRLDALDVLK